MAKLPPRLSPEEKKRVIATAWTDLPPYLQIQNDHAISPAELNALMKRELTPSAYKEWAARGKNTKPATKSTWPPRTLTYSTKDEAAHDALRAAT